MDKSRERFDQWFHSRYDQIKMTDHERLMLKTNQWAAWQASRSTIEIELPPLMKIEEPGISFCAYGRAGVLNGIYEQGLKVKE